MSRPTAAASRSTGAAATGAAAIALVLLAAAPLALPAQQESRTAFTPDDLVRLKRLSDPRVSPDGRYVVYVLRETDMEANRGRTDLWLLDLAAKSPQPRPLTRNPAEDSNPRWSRDGRTIWFLSTRSGSSQVWRIALDGGEAVQASDLPLDVDTLEISPAGDRIALSMSVLPECGGLACTKTKLAERAKQKASGRTFDRLFVRHWSTWSDGTRSHLFTAPLGVDGKLGTPVDLSRTLDADVPSKPFGGSEDYAFSPDGRRVVFSARIAGRSEPWSTNFDLYEVPADGSAPPQNLTADNPAWDAQPVFLANGDLVWLAMRRPGFEADRYRITIRDAKSGATRVVAEEWDRSPGHLEVARDGRTLLVTADDVGQHPLFAIDPAKNTVRTIVKNAQVNEYEPTADGVIFAWASLATPADLYAVKLAGGEPRRLTAVNADVLDRRAMAPFEPFSFAGWNDEPVHGFVMKPFGFREGQKYPIAFIVHGGPQTAFSNGWSYRWNAQAFAGAGYAVVFVDFHGSTGYGQTFTDSISRDWGGKPLVDLQKGLAAALQKHPWLDGDRACALGASYGGFMMNWIAGRWPDRFRCLVNHAGLFDQRAMYYTTEELWFPEWEQGGPYYDDPADHEKFSPSNYVKEWRTPMLVTHGERDFRVPYTQGLATFTALQRRGIESRLLIFPDENHWVLKPANSVQWHAAVLDWLDAHLQAR